MFFSGLQRSKSHTKKGRITIFQLTRKIRHLHCGMSDTEVEEKMSKVPNDEFSHKTLRGT